MSHWPLNILLILVVVMAQQITGHQESRRYSMKEDLLVDVRRKNPLIHHLTNQVVMNFSANGLLAFGGSPIMAKAQEEVHEIARMADRKSTRLNSSHVAIS